MLVRDRLADKSYRGREVSCPDEVCPCRECFHVHNCNYRVGNKYIDRFVCLTNFEHGCPDPKPVPKHVIYLAGQDYQRFRKKMMETGTFPPDRLRRTCRRCGQRIDLAHSNFETTRR